MNLTTLSGGAAFWDNFAQWYEKWINRGIYHRSIIHELAQMIEPGWNVLDIGAATGVLSIPLAALGCKVTALEPSEGMRKILKEKITSLKVQHLELCSETWEETNQNRIKNLDLIVACNSLHFVNGGITEGMSKVFSFLPAYVCLITEINQGFFIDFKSIDALQHDFNFLYIKKFVLDSSFYFEDMDEVHEFERVISQEINVIAENEIFLQRDKTDLAIVWWERK